MIAVKLMGMTVLASIAGGFLGLNGSRGRNILFVLVLGAAGNKEHNDRSEEEKRF